MHGRLPAVLSPIIGRDDEVQTVFRQMMSPQVRLLTLTGPPGIGKTRLAFEVVSRLEERFTDGARFVDLAPIRDPALIVSGIARALGMREVGDFPFIERLTEFLERKHLVLMLDNVEHVIEGASQIADLLAVCTQLKVLATSRERLRLAGEHEFPVPPLAMPDLSRSLNSDGISRSPAVTLFVERAQAVEPSFDLTPDNARAVAEICVRLGGVPLAIELCASRVKLMRPQEIVTHLEHQLALLTGGFRNVPARHRTLRAAIAYSYDLLPPDQQMLLRRLAIFTGAWTLEAVEHVCGQDSLDVLEALASLIDKSLVRRAGDRDPVARFDLLESIREFGGEQLDAHGETRRAAHSHAVYFARLAEQGEAAIGTTTYAEATMVRLRQDYDNLRSALEWTLQEGETATALRLAAGLGWYWHSSGDVGVGRPLMERALDTGEGPEDARAAALIPAGAIAWSQGDFARATAWLEEALAINHRLGRKHHLARAMAFLGNTARSQGDFARAAALHEQALATYDELENRWGSAWSIYDLGLVARDQGADTRARALFEESLNRFQEMRYGWATAWARWNLGILAARRGADAEAAEFYGESLVQYWQLEDRRGVAQCLEGLAVLAGQRNALKEAGRLLGAAEALRTALGVPPDPAQRGEVASAAQRVRERLGAAAFVQASGEGRAQSLEETIDVALRLFHARSGATGSRMPEGPRLTARERQVATLIAQGYSNRQIGSALSIAERTAISHVEHIMNKLSVNSRAQIAVWAVHNGLEPPVET